MGFPTLQTLCTRVRYLSNKTPGRFLQVRSAEVWKLTLQKTRRHTPPKCDRLGSRASWLFRTRMDIITLMNCKLCFQSIIRFVNLFTNWLITITWQMQVISPNAKPKQIGKKSQGWLVMNLEGPRNKCRLKCLRVMGIIKELLKLFFFFRLFVGPGRTSAVQVVCILFTHRPSYFSFF